MSTLEERAEAFWNANYANKTTAKQLAEFAKAERELQRAECADAAEKAISTAPDYESMHEMARKAILAAGREPPEWCEHCKISEGGQLVHIIWPSDPSFSTTVAINLVGQCPIVGCGKPKPVTT